MTNCITSRSCLLIFLAAVRAVWTAIEQPMTSSLRHIPYFSYLQVLLQLCGNHTWKYCSLCLSCQFEFAVVDVTVYCMYVYLCTHQLSWLGLYGHSNAKPSYCIGSASVSQLLFSRNCFGGSLQIKLGTQEMDGQIGQPYVSLQEKGVFCGSG